MARSDQQRQDTRERILQAAFRIVSEGGYRDAQVATVAAAAGIATGTVYLYFPSKADLCAEVFRFASSHEEAVMASIGALQETATVRIESAVRTFVRRALRGPRLAYALLVEPVDPAVEAERIKAKRAFSGIFAEILREGIADGELPEQNAEWASACLIGALVEALVGPLTPETAKRADAEQKLEEVVTAFCLRAVGARMAA